ncbi:MAG: efflux RND transporter periplasmic adaptor subunit [Aquabacterium sp.]|uniref:efflux RND transporter periplasmic adaptor subunit n=1 Tax=Aquabacterium sp. TaxID=1872578 RepID=UPI00120DEA4D|nr:efflux RND transporter periplasmic adaptor subunit [Aquabacterium sp.]TAK95334.1 MAG: efflux RND transporter periplasmic adaptor subunit [Aquabacterium sp.]
MARHHAVKFLLLAPLLAANLPTQAQNPGLTVPTLRVQSQAREGVLEWDGMIQAVRQSTVAAQVPGNITALFVKAGDTVKAGQALVQIDARDTQAALTRSQAEVAQADAQLTNARLQWERSQALKSQGFISPAALDAAQAQWRSAQALFNAAKAGQTQAALAKGFTTITAPFDGRVLTTQADVGDLASPGRPILTLYAPQAMRAVVQVPASLAERIRTARSTEVLLPASGNVNASAQWVRASRAQALPGADAVSQTIEWRLDLPATTALPGQTSRVRFSDMASASPGNNAQETGLSVPAAAVMKRGELTAVYVVREGQFMLQAVRTAPVSAQASSVTVLSGIRAGDTIAADALKAGLANASPAKP